MNKPWLKYYSEGVPAEIDPSCYRSIVDLIEESFQTFKDRTAYVCMDQCLTFGQTDQLSQKLGAWLQYKGVPKGARIALMMPNILLYPVAIAAILRAGYVVVNVNPLYTARELEFQLVDSEAQAIIILENFAATLEQVLHKTRIQHVIVSGMGDLFSGIKGPLVNFVVRHVKKLVPSFSLPNAVRLKKILSEAGSMKLTPVITSSEDIAFLQYTGGTTGVSKGAMLTHRNIVANVMQNDAWLRPVSLKEPVVEQMTFMCALPLYHIFALMTCYLVGMKTGAMNILIPNPRDIADFIKVLAHYPVHLFPAVNTLFNGLVNHPDFEKLDFSSLKSCIGGGMAVQKAVADKWFKSTGCIIIEGYGLSETSPCVVINPIDAPEFSGMIGVPIPSTEVVILDDDGHVVPLGQSGEIAIRGPQVMAGYWHRPDETAKVMTSDGFLKSGDIGIMDERGYIKIVDRKKDMIVVSGFKVYPNEIEAVVAMYPGVLECACVGIPDEHSGEAVKLFVVPKNPTVTVAQLEEYCKTEFTGYKRPKYIELRTSLPKSPVGKILRRELREEKSN